MAWDVPKWWEIDPMEKFARGFQIGQAVSQAGLHQQALENSIKEQQLQIAGQGLQNRARAMELEHAITEFPNQEKMLDLKRQQLEVQSNQQKAAWEQQKTNTAMQGDFAETFYDVEPGSEEDKRKLDAFSIRHQSAHSMPEFQKRWDNYGKVKTAATQNIMKGEQWQLGYEKAIAVQKLRNEGSEANTATTVKGREDVAAGHDATLLKKQSMVHKLTPTAAANLRKELGSAQAVAGDKSKTEDERTAAKVKADAISGALDDYEEIRQNDSKKSPPQTNYRWDKDTGKVVPAE